MSGAKELEASHGMTQELRKGIQRPKNTCEVRGKPHTPKLYRPTIHTSTARPYQVLSF